MNNHSYKKTASFLKLVGEETRLKILTTLITSKGKLCVNEVAKRIGMSQSATSHQLSRLEKARIIAPQTAGQKSCYILLDTVEAKQAFALLNLFK